MSTAASLASLLQHKSDLNYYVQQLTWYTNKSEATSAKVARYEKYETEWEKEYDKARDGSRSSKITINGVEYDKECDVGDALAEQYAYEKVQQRDEAILLELTEEDNEYESQKTMLDTLCEELRADIDSEKQLVSNNAQNTHLLGS